MATVRITQRLVEDVVYEARKLFDSRIADAEKVPDLGRPICELLREAYVCSRMSYPEFAKIPETWWPRAVYFRVHEFNGLPVDYTFTHNGGLYAPAPMSNPVFSINSPAHQDAAQALHDWRENDKALRAQREQYAKDVEKYLAAYTTLKPALEGWPALWELLSTEVKERHERPTVKTETKFVPPAVDIQAMSGQIVIAKIINS